MKAPAAIKLNLRMRKLPFIRPNPRMRLRIQEKAIGMAPLRM
jgi:hypothetical protein